MATKVFISYRREDSAGHAGRVMATLGVIDIFDEERQRGSDLTSEERRSTPPPLRAAEKIPTATLSGSAM
jgi:hypothetical protein